MFASLLRLPTLSYTVDSLLRFAPVASFAPAHVALRAAFGRLPSQRPLACVRSRSVDSQDLPTCSSFGAALRQSISTFPEGLDSPYGPTCGCSISHLPPSAISAPPREVLCFYFVC